MEELKKYKKILRQVKVTRVAPGILIHDKRTGEGVMTSKDKAYVITYPDECQEPVRAKILAQFFTWINGTKIEPEKLEFGRFYKARESVLQAGSEVYATVATEYRTMLTDDPWLPKSFQVKPGDVIMYPVKDDGTPDLKKPSKLDGEVFAKCYEEL